MGLDGLGEDPYTHLGALHRRSRQTVFITDLRTTATTLTNGLIGCACVKISPLGQTSDRSNLKEGFILLTVSEGSIHYVREPVGK